MAELRLKSTGTIKLFENDNTSNVTIASPASLGADRTITLPDASVTLASGTMLATDGDGSSLSGVGKIGQVVSATTTGGVTTSSTTYVTTGLTVTVPSLATTSSKVFVTVDSPACYEDNSPNSYVYCTLYADIDSAGDVDLGNSTSGFSGWNEHGIAYDDLGWNASFSFLHSPSTTADVVYTVYFRTNNASASYVWNLSGQGTITAMEVLA